MANAGKKGLKLGELTLFAMLGALTFAAKVAMSGLPNIEPVSLMVMLFAVTFGRKCLYPIYVYVLMEFLLYGLNLWSVSYLYIWALLALGAWFLRKSDSPLVWALLSGVFGLLFGFLCAPVYLVTGGLGTAVSWWISGIPFDLIHCGANFAIALVLFKPLRGLMARLWKEIQKH